MTLEPNTDRSQSAPPPTSPGTAAAQPAQSPSRGAYGLEAFTPLSAPKKLTPSTESFSDPAIGENAKMIRESSVVGNGQSPGSIHKRNVARVVVDRELSNSKDALKHSSQSEPLIAEVARWAGQGLKVASCGIGVIALATGVIGEASWGSVASGFLLVCGGLFLATGIIETAAKYHATRRNNATDDAPKKSDADHR